MPASGCRAWRGAAALPAPSGACFAAVRVARAASFRPEGIDRALRLPPAITGTLAGGHALTVVSAVTRVVGPRHRRGQDHRPERDLRGRRARSAGRSATYPSLLTFDVDAARARIEQLPWVKQATLEEALPQYARSLHRRAYALRHLAARRQGFVDRRMPARSSPMPSAIAMRNCPSWSAPVRRQRAKEFADLIAAAPDLTGKVRAGVLISGRRWNVVLDNGIELLLPAENPAAALATVAKLDAEKSLLSRADRGGRSAPARPVDPAADRAGAGGPQGHAQGARQARAAQKDEHLMRLFGISDHGGRGASRRAKIVSVLDVGSSKICCLIARLKPLRARRGAARPHPLDRGARHRPPTLARHQVRRRHQSRRGRAGDPAARSTPPSAWPGSPSSRSSSASPAAGWRARPTLLPCRSAGQAIADADIGRVLAAGRRHSISEGRAVVHSLPIGYSLDGEQRHRRSARHDRPAARRRHARRHRRRAAARAISSCASTAATCRSRRWSPRPMPAACPRWSTTRPNSAAPSSISAAAPPRSRCSAAAASFTSTRIAVGGQHITTDIARGLSTRIDDAERLKTMYGSALPGAADDRDMLSVPPIGDDDEREVPNQVPRSALTRIIRPRIEEILELVRDRLNASGFAGLVGRRMVLTGGASQLTGLGEAARRILARNVRLGRPLGITGMPEVARGPGLRRRRRAADLSAGRRHRTVRRRA